MREQLITKWKAFRTRWAEALSAIIIVPIVVAAEAAILILLLRPHGYDQRKDFAQILATVAAGTAVLAQVYLTRRNIQVSRDIATEKADLDREGQITERFTKAVEQLGSDQSAICLGGVYALERIAKDSSKDHGTVMEVLTAFLRQRSYSTLRVSMDLEMAKKSPQYNPVTGEHYTLLVAEDEARNLAHSILTVLGRRTLGHEEPGSGGLDLSRITTPGVELMQGDFDRARFHGSNMHRMKFWFTRLNRASFRHAILEYIEAYYILIIGTSFWGANLKGAKFWWCHFDNTDFSLASLDSAVIGNQWDGQGNTDLNSSNFYEASLKDARFTLVIANGAKFADARFDRTILENVDFRGAIGLTQEQINGCIFQGEVLLPPGLHGPGEPSPGVPD